MSAPQSLPRSLQITAHKPQAVAATRRRVKTIAQTVNSFTPGQYIEMKIDTATHGSFMDPKTTQLEFNLNIINSNPYVDFQNFPVCGANVIFEEMRLNVAGAPVEENISYAECMTREMNANGNNAEPMHMFVSNRWCDQYGMGSNVIAQMIKPSMVDWLGQPMYAGRPLWLDGYKIGSQINPNVRLEVDNGFLSDASGVQTVSQFTATRGISHPGIYGKNQGSFDWGNGNPAFWPINQPFAFDPDHERRLASFNLKDYLEFYSNVKSLPIGIKVPETVNYARDQKQVVANATHTAVGDSEAVSLPSSTTTTLHISTPILSGIIGLLAEKMFPSLLIGPGKMSLQFKLAPPEKVFQLTMDPCRRVPGTTRDYKPFKFLLNNSKTFKMISPVQEAIAAGQALYSDVIPVDPTKFYAENVAAGDLQYADYAGVVGDVVDALDNASARHKYFLQSVIHPVIYVGSAHSGVDHHITNSGNSLDGTYLLVPQYIPADLSGTVGGKNVYETIYSTEAATCYGTFLRASVPQSRRCHSSAEPLSVSEIPAASHTTYTVDRIGMTYEEILMPDRVTAAMMQASLSNEVSIHTEMYKPYRTVTIPGETQQIVAPIRVQSASTLTYLFRHMDQISGPKAQSFNSMSFINPFAFISGIDDASDPSLVLGHANALMTNPVALYTKAEADVGKSIPHEVSALSTKEALGINIQLAIGNMRYPPQPIDSVAELLVENAKARHSLASTAHRSANVSSYVTTDASYLKVNTIQDGFFATHVPIHLLEDQTCTCNQAMNIVSGPDEYICAKRRYATSLPLFVPPTGTFEISFDLDTYPNASDKMRGGTQIINNQVVLNLNKAHLLKSHPFQVDLIVRMDARLSIQSGGEMVTIY